MSWRSRSTNADLVIRREPPTSPAGQRILRAYLQEIVGRYHHRPATPAELDAESQEVSPEDLILPRGLFWIALWNEIPSGCVGLRLLPEGVGEVVRLFVDRRHRRQGIARQLMGELEHEARRRGLGSLRLDTRHDLTEARALYADLGFAEVPAFNREPYAEHWFERALV